MNDLHTDGYILTPDPPERPCPTCGRDLGTHARYCSVACRHESEATPFVPERAAERLAALKGWSVERAMAAVCPDATELVAAMVATPMSERGM